MTGLIVSDSEEKTITDIARRSRVFGREAQLSSAYTYLVESMDRILNSSKVEGLVIATRAFRDTLQE